MLDQIPGELVHAICDLAGESDYSTLAALSTTSRTISIHSQPLLYRDIYFIEAPGTPQDHDDVAPRKALSIHQIHHFCGIMLSSEQLARCVIGFGLEIDRYTKQRHAIVDLILQRTVNLVDLRVDYYETDMIRNLPACFDGKPPFTLRRFSWLGNTYSENRVMTNFLTAQTSLRHLEIRSFHASLSDTALPHLRILQSQLRSAIRLGLGRNITHLYIHTFPPSISLGQGADDAFRSVKVFKAHWSYLHIMQVASRMSGLECLEAGGEWLLQDIVSDLYVIQSSPVQRIRLIPSGDVSGHDAEPAIDEVLKRLKNLRWVERPLRSGVFKRRYRDSRELMVRWAGLSSAWLEDWEDGYEFVRE